MYAIPNLATCSDVPTTVTPRWVHSTGKSFVHTGFWVDFATNLLYIGDTSGNLYAMDGDSGTAIAGFPRLLTASALHTFPVVWNGVVWLGNDAGQLLRVDATSGAVLSTTNLCPGTCGADDAVYATPWFDMGREVVIAAANQRMFELSPLGAITATLPFLTGHPGAVWSSPSVDLDSTPPFAYVGFDNQLFKIAYPITAGSTILSQPTVGTGDVTHPRSSPTLFNGNLFIGDGGGFMDRFVLDGSTTVFAAPAASPQYGSSIDTTCVIDYLTYDSTTLSTGNIYFGASGSASGNLVQITRAY